MSLPLCAFLFYALHTAVDLPICVAMDVEGGCGRGKRPSFFSFHIYLLWSLYFFIFLLYFFPTVSFPIRLYPFLFIIYVLLL